MTEESQYDVFLSHNSTDKPTVETLARRLVEAGLTPWLDTRNLVSCALTRDRQIPALCGKIGASDGDLAIPSDQVINARSSPPPRNGGGRGKRPQWDHGTANRNHWPR